MDQKVERIITEKLPLAQCVAGDDIDIRYSHNGSWKSIGRGTLVKVKPLPKGGHQIKFRSAWGRKATIQKHDIPAGVVVERRRPATEADGPDAGEPVRQVRRIDDIDYAIAPLTRLDMETCGSGPIIDSFPEVYIQAVMAEYANPNLALHLVGDMQGKMSTLLLDTLLMAGGRLERLPGGKD